MAGRPRGDVSTAGICGVADRNVSLYAPVPEKSPAPGSGQSPPPPAVVAWRARMATDEGKTQYKIRAATAERIHADAKTHRAFRALPVRGLLKVHTWALWTALAINVLRVMGIVPHQMTQNGRRGARLPVAPTACAAWRTRRNGRRASERRGEATDPH